MRINIWIILGTLLALLAITRYMHASKKAPLEAGLKNLGNSNSAIACQLGALWRIRKGTPSGTPSAFMRQNENPARVCLPEVLPRGRDLGNPPSSALKLLLLRRAPLGKCVRATEVPAGTRRD
jgi:hypothetical protein